MRSSTGMVQVKIFDVTSVRGAEGHTTTRKERTLAWARLSELTPRQQAAMMQIGGVADVQLVFLEPLELSMGKVEYEYEDDLLGTRVLDQIGPAIRIKGLPNADWTQVYARWREDSKG